MNLIDLHADTLHRFKAAGTGYYAATDAGADFSRLSDIADNDGHISLDRMQTGPLAGCSYCQAFAIFFDDGLRGQDAIDFYDSYLQFWKEQIARHADRVMQVRSVADIEDAWSQGKCAALLTIEGGAAVAGDIQRVQALYDDGVRIMNLVWNGKNQIASGYVTEEGITSFGRQVVAEMERLGIVADVSHLNDQGFWDLDVIAQRPFIASHSNLRSYSDHRRNLTDDQFKCIVERGGLAGFNFWQDIIAPQGEAPTPEHMRRHIEKMLDLGGEDVVALGSDYDGADIPSWLQPCGKRADLFEMMVGWFGTELAEKILAGNALSFFRRYESAR